jgi:hypothetical protein
MGQVIEPTVGRIVHAYFQYVNEVGTNDMGKPLAAIVTGVKDLRTVDLAIFCAGSMMFRVNVPLVQPGDTVPESIGLYCQWMPYQVKKSFGSESGEKAAGVEGV